MTMAQLGFQLLHTRLQLVDGISKRFNGVVSDGSHCGLKGSGRGLTKAEESLVLNCSIYFDLGPKGGGKDRLLVERASSATLGPSVCRSFSLVIKYSWHSGTANVQISSLSELYSYPCPRSAFVRTTTYLFKNNDFAIRKLCT